MLHTFKDLNSQQQHKCQIDCTNHDEVINKLQVKSKDLYYFWRNYEWLYNKYYNEPKRTDDSQIRQVQQKIRLQYESKVQHYRTTIQNNEHQLKGFQQQVANLQQKNQRLAIQLQSLNKEIQKKKSSDSSLEADYQRQIKRLKSKLNQYEEIQENINRQLTQSNRTINMLKRDIDQERRNNLSQKKTLDAQLFKLQQTVDQLRLQIANQPVPQIPKGQRRSQQLSYRIQEVTSALSEIKNSCYQLISREMQQTKGQIREQLRSFLYGLTRRQLQSLIVDAV